MKRYIAGVLAVAAAFALMGYWKAQRQQAEAPARGEAPAFLEQHDDKSRQVIEFIGQQGQQAPPQRGR